MFTYFSTGRFDTTNKPINEKPKFLCMMSLSSTLASCFPEYFRAADVNLRNSLRRSWDSNRQRPDHTLTRCALTNSSYSPCFLRPAAVVGCCCRGDSPAVVVVGTCVCVNLSHMLKVELLNDVNLFL